MKGVAGKILVVDLTSGTWESQSLPEEIYRKYLGGYGLGAYYIYKNISPNCDPLGPDNILGFLPGFLTGIGPGFSGRYMVCGKSPLTGKGIRSNGEYCSGGWGNANSGGHFGPSIKRAGFDGIFFHGASDHPVYLLIKGSKISIENAEFLWGKDAIETDEDLQKRHGILAHVAAIGRAGENKSLISGIVNDHGRIAARSGLGAVMGSKKLKAICILEGKKRIEYVDRPTIRMLNKTYYAHVDTDRKNKQGMMMPGIMNYLSVIFRLAKVDLFALAPGDNMGPTMGAQYGGAKLGTPSSYVLSAQTADAPIKNFEGNATDDFSHKEAMQLRVQLINKHMDRQYGCNSCPLQCGAILKYENLPYENKETHRPEYETIAGFGSNLLCSDMDMLLKANEYCNREGLDTISTSGTIAYILEAVERGIFKKEDFACQAYPQGFLPKFRESTFILDLLKLMVTREGIGDKLADGTFVASQHFPETKEFAINANGSELGMHDPRNGKAWAQTYIADPTPGRHTVANYDQMFTGQGGFYPAFKDKYRQKAETLYEMGRASAQGIILHQVLESLGLCMFSYFFMDYHLEEYFKAIAGWDMNVDEIMNIGYRIQVLRQMFNAREGAIRHEMPQRVLGSPPLKNGNAAGKSVDAELMVQGYYKGIGFKQDGIPTEETLRTCGLEEIIPDLKDCTGAPERLVNEYLVAGGGQKKEKHTPAIGG